MMKVCSFLIDFGQFAKVLKRDRLGGETSLAYYSRKLRNQTHRFLWKIKVWFLESGNDFKTSICIMHSLD